MNSLVELRNGEVMTTSLIFAEEFELNHQHVLEKIKNLTVEYPTIKKQFKQGTFINDRNREYPMYYITRDGYMTLVMNTSAKGKSVELLFNKKQLFIQAFNKMESLLLAELNNKKNAEWITTREQGKKVRIELADTIKDFIEYAKNQGSNHAENYYRNITKMEYKALGIMQQAKPELRNTLDCMQLYQILLAEDIAKKRIQEYMNQKLHYKEIYILVKQDIENYAKTLYIQSVADKLTDNN